MSIADAMGTNGGNRQTRQSDRQRAIQEAVMTEGAVRIEALAERFGISVMTVHRDLDELESRGLLRKSRGLATALSTSLIESSDVYRSGRQLAEKDALAAAALDFIEPGQAVFMDDSTTVAHIVPLLADRAPLTIITNVLPLMDKISGMRGMSLLAIGGNYYNWCSSFMGRMTNEAIANLRADVFLLSTSAVVDDICMHQTMETIDTKRAMFDSAATRILLVDHTKFEKRALYALAPLTEFDVVIVDEQTDRAHVERLRSQGVEVVVAPAVTAAQ